MKLTLISLCLFPLGCDSSYEVRHLTNAKVISCVDNNADFMFDGVVFKVRTDINCHAWWTDGGICDVEIRKPVPDEDHIFWWHVMNARKAKK